MSKLVKSVTSIFKSPKAPTAAAAAAPTPAPEAPPSVDTAGVQAAGDAERRKKRAASGRASTMLTGGRGVTTDATIGTKKLLG